MHRLFIHHRSKHHSGFSGYAKLLDYLKGTVIDGSSSKLPYKIAKFISTNVSSKSGNYDSQSVYKELELYKKLKSLKNQSNIVHYLNAERDLKYNINYKTKFTNTKFVATFHKPPAILKDRIKKTKYLKKLDGAICVGQNQVEFIKNWLNIDQVAYIPHGVDTCFFKPDTSIKKEHQILFVGQHLRDFEILNWAIPKFETYDNKLKLVVVGIPSALKKVKQAKNLKKFTGVGDEELKRLYQTSKLLFLPLVDSTACNSILEAMACGLPIVTNNVGGNMAYLEGTDSCFENDAEVLFQEVITLLESKEKRKVQSARLREKALGYDWKVVAKQVSDFHRKVMLA